MSPIQLQEDWDSRQWELGGTLVKTSVSSETFFTQVSFLPMMFRTWVLEN